MFVQETVTECDATGQKYDKPVKGAHCIAQGASGRFCCVLHVGPEYLTAHEIVPITREAAIDEALNTLKAQTEAKGKKYSRLDLDVMFIDF